MYPEPGKYKHFRGKLYKVVGVARHSSNMGEFVVYMALYGEKKLWVRPLKEFTEEVEVGDFKQPRFRHVPNVPEGTFIDGQLKDPDSCPESDNGKCTKCGAPAGARLRIRRPVWPWQLQLVRNVRDSLRLLRRHRGLTMKFTMEIDVNVKGLIDSYLSYEGYESLQEAFCPDWPDLTPEEKLMIDPQVILTLLDWQIDRHIDGTVNDIEHVEDTPAKKKAKKKRKKR